MFSFCYTEDKINMITLWKQIPNDMLNRILSYSGVIKYRNGKYINQIPNDDNRYCILQTIPKIHSHYSIFWYMSTSYTYNINKFYIEKSLSSYEGEPLISIIVNKYCCEYRFTNQGFFYRYIIYTKQPTFVEYFLQVLYNIYSKYI
jgi:hypothetical protein